MAQAINHGRPWTKRDDLVITQAFIECIQSGFEQPNIIGYIAKELGRSRHAVECRIGHLITNENQVRFMHEVIINDNINMDFVQKEFDAQIQLDRQRYRAEQQSNQEQLVARIKVGLSSLTEDDFYRCAISTVADVDMPIVMEYKKAMTKLHSQQMAKSKRANLIYLRRSYRKTIADLLASSQNQPLVLQWLTINKVQ